MIFVTSISILETRGILDTKLVENRASDVRSGLQYWDGFNHDWSMVAEDWGGRDKEFLDDMVRSYVPCAASFAHHGLLNSWGVWGALLLHNINLSSVPAAHIASLVSLVTSALFMRNVRGCSLVPILDNVKCDLTISCQSLDSEETAALARAIGCRGVNFSLGGRVKFDMSTLSTENVLVEHVDRYKKSCKVTKRQKIKNLCNIV